MGMARMRTISGAILAGVGALGLIVASAAAGLETIFRGFGMEIGVESFWRNDPGHLRYFLAALFRLPFPGWVTVASLVASISGLRLLARRRKPAKPLTPGDLP